MSLSSVRFALGFAAIATLVLALGFYRQSEWATRLWPWQDGRMSYIFISSILAAIAAPILWVALTGELRASEPGAINLGITFAGGGLYLLWSAFDTGGSAITIAAVVFLATALFQVVVFRWCRAYRMIDQRPMPVLVRGSFAVFAIGLIVVGSALVLRAEHIFPWPLNPDSSVIFGWIFLGAAAYFTHAVLRPSWANAAGQLLGFLAYDIVLIWPFLDHFDTVAADHRTSLTIYTAVVIYSAILALYYLVINPTTRLWSHQHGVADVNPQPAIDVP